MQKTGWTIHSPFLVLFGLKKNFTLDVITRGQATTIFLCIGPFWHGNIKQTNEQPGDPSAGLLLTSEKAVFLQFCIALLRVNIFLNILATFPSTSKSQSDLVTIQTVNKKRKQNKTL